MHPTHTPLTLLALAAVAMPLVGQRAAPDAALAPVRALVTGPTLSADVVYSGGVALADGGCAPPALRRAAPSAP